MPRRDPDRPRRDLALKTLPELATPWGDAGSIGGSIGRSIAGVATQEQPEPRSPVRSIADHRARSRGRITALVGLAAAASVAASWSSSSIKGVLERARRRPKRRSAAADCARSRWTTWGCSRRHWPATGKLPLPRRSAQRAVVRRRIPRPAQPRPRPRSKPTIAPDAAGGVPCARRVSGQPVSAVVIYAEIAIFQGQRVWVVGFLTTPTTAALRGWRSSPPPRAIARSSTPAANSYPADRDAAGRPARTRRRSGRRADEAAGTAPPESVFDDLGCTPWTERNVIILGIGPGRATAALYAARANLQPLVLKGVDAGGQLMLTTEVENFPGSPTAILGPELMERMEKQAGPVRRRAPAPGGHLGRPLRARRSASGRATRSGAPERSSSPPAPRPRCSASPSERRLLGRGVSTCATCDGFFFRGREMLVVGGGDSAMEEALFLTRFATKVTVVHRRDSLRASKIMQDRALAQREDLVRVELGRRGGPRRRTRSRACGCATSKTGERPSSPPAGVFVAIGHTPNTDAVRGPARAWTSGYIVVEEPTTRDQRPGRVRGRRRRRPHLPAGRDRGRHGLQGRHRRRALARGAGT